MLSPIDPANPSDVRWMLADHLGTIRDVALLEIVNDEPQTTVSAHLSYDSFGNRVDTEAIDLFFAYTGRAHDEATGLQNNLNRWFDTKTGTFISEDPSGIEPDVNEYRYVANHPTMATDPSGLVELKKGGFDSEVISSTSGLDFGSTLVVFGQSITDSDSYYESMNSPSTFNSRHSIDWIGKSNYESQYDVHQPAGPVIPSEAVPYVVAWRKREQQLWDLQRALAAEQLREGIQQFKAPAWNSVTPAQLDQGRFRSLQRKFHAQLFLTQEDHEEYARLGAVEAIQMKQFVQQDMSWIERTLDNFLNPAHPGNINDILITFYPMTALKLLFRRS